MVLLINPSINPRTLPKAVTDVMRYIFPMSLGYLAAYLIHKKYPVRIIDDQITPLIEKNLQEFISAMNHPRIIGLTTLTPTCSRVYELTEMIKKIASEVIVVLGGIHPSVLPEESLSRTGVDIVVRGEGEETFSELVENITKGEDYRHIRGISYREDGRFIHNEDRPLIEDLNSLPPFPYHLFEADKDRYPGFFTMQTSRGCPYSCSFCSQRSVSGRRYRYVSAERAIRDIELLIKRYGADRIMIYDDNIGSNRKRLIQLLNAIIERGINKKVSFQTLIRGDNLDEELLEKLKEANFTQLIFGLETASESLMKLMNKGETVSDVVHAVRMTDEAGIEAAATVIFGLPTETDKDRWDAIRLVSSLPLSSVRFNNLVPYPGTPIYETLRKERKLIISGDWENFATQHIWAGDDLPYVPDGTDKYELMLFIMFANLWFYLRPGGIIKLFIKQSAGSTAIALQRHWYFSSFLFKVMRLGVYFLRRFLGLSVKIAFRKVFPLRSF